MKIHKMTMSEESRAFKELFDDFVRSAETERQLALFPTMGIAAWNLSFHDKERRNELIKGKSLAK